MNQHTVITSTEIVAHLVSVGLLEQQRQLHHFSRRHTYITTVVCVYIPLYGSHQLYQDHHLSASGADTADSGGKRSHHPDQSPAERGERGTDCTAQSQTPLGSRGH